MPPFESWSQAVTKDVSREAWHPLFAAVNWSLWSHRNRIIFNQASLQVEDLWWSIRKHAKEWFYDSRRKYRADCAKR